MDNSKLKQLAVQLRQLADRFEGLANGRIESNPVELNKIKLLVSLIVKELVEVWL